MPNGSHGATLVVISGHNHPVIQSTIAQCPRVIGSCRLIIGCQWRRLAGTEINVIGYRVTTIGVTPYPAQGHVKTLPYRTMRRRWIAGLVGRVIPHSEAQALAVAYAIAYSLGPEIVGGGRSQVS